MRFNSIKAMLLISVCAAGLSACESMDTAWDDMTGDNPPYAGNIQPQQQAMQPMGAPQQQPMMPNQQMAMQQQPMQPMMQQPMTAQQPVVPPTAMQPTMVQPMAQQQPVMAPNNYQPNLASVPARPMASELPSQQQVQQARQQLSNDNQMMTGYLRDPRGTTAPTQAMPQQAQAVANNYYQPPMPNQNPLAAYQPPAQPQQQPAQNYAQQQPAQALAPMQAAASVEGQLLGLQPTANGQYALTPLAPEAPLGGFALASSLQYAPNNQVSMPQYQQLKTVAGQYAAQPGRVRVVSYGDAQNSKALQNATTTAAYLVDMGVPANAIRVKIDNAAGADPMAQSKTDIFLETPAQR